MITLQQLEKLRLHRRPAGQLVMANLVLSWDYLLPRRTRIVLEGLDNLPRDRTVFLAMNHTDRYNYWPAQYAMYRAGLPFTATWVKGKYYDKAMTARFLDSTNNIPLPSRGYVLVAEFRKAMGRRTEADEYRFLRDLVDGAVQPEDADLAGQTPAVRQFVADRGGSLRGFVDAFEQRFEPMIAQVIRLNRQAICELGVNVLVFPQGTRSKRLAKGHTGMIQLAMHLGAAVVPVGCNGADKLYPGVSPFSKGGKVTYRFGTPMEPTGPELGPYRVQEPYVPLTRSAAERHGVQFRAATEVIMQRINGLLDVEYQAAADGASDGVRGIDRFL